MEFVIGLILVALAVYVLVKFVLPAIGIISLVVLGVGACYAFFLSIACFGRAVTENIDPYLTYIDPHKVGQNSRRNYFFGPGIHQMREIVAEAFLNLRDHAQDLTTKRKDFTLAHGWFLNIFGFIFYISVQIFTYVFGTVWILLFSICLLSVIMVGMLLFYVLFSILWLADRTSLLIRCINSRCPNDKRRSVVPLFMCPRCSTKHKNLVPGPYGVLYRTCDCGERLPTTVFNGRSKLDAFCPFCEEPLASGGARQFGIQMVGAIDSGKTTFLAAFQHVYQERLRNRGETDYQLSKQADFDELEDLFQNGVSSSTRETNARMYSILRHPGSKTPLQMTIYDIAGEVFEMMTLNYQGQQQLEYCEGVIFIIDPDEDPSKAEDSITALATEHKQMRGRLKNWIRKTPIAVVISKADLYKREIGHTHIHVKAQSIFNNTEGGDLEQIQIDTRNQICRAFLQEHGFGNLIFLLESSFPKCCYFSASAIGHPQQQGASFAPWGVEEPVQWLAGKAGVSY